MSTSSIPALIAGAGPAGISAALWLRDFGVPFRWFDARELPGGILHRVHNQISNFPGQNFPDGDSLARVFQTQLEEIDLCHQVAKIQRIRRHSETLEVEFYDRSSLRAERILLATGTSYRTLQVPGEEQALGRSVRQSAARDAERFRNQKVAVVGGGDAAFENALRLARVGCEVTLLLRSQPTRARSSFVDAARSHPQITLAPIPTIITSLEETTSGCRLHLDQAGACRSLEVAALFVRIGVEPNLPQGLKELQQDSQGYLFADPQGRTSDPAILAAGDLLATPLRAVATAVGAGALAAHTIASDLGYL